MALKVPSTSDNRLRADYSLTFPISTHFSRKPINQFSTFALFGITYIYISEIISASGI